MTGEHRDYEQVPLERAQCSGGEGKVVPKRACPALKLPSVGKGLEGPCGLHLKMQQTAVDDVLGVYYTRILKQGGKFFFQADTSG